MICYLDASALVKLYVSEPGSEIVEAAVAEARMVGTAMITRVEVATALARAMRLGALSVPEAELAHKAFHDDWSQIFRLHVSEFLTERGALIGWEQGLRAYDAVQLAAAVTWREVLEEPIVMMTFDRQLWAAAGKVGLEVAPKDLPRLLEAWKASS